MRKIFSIVLKYLIALTSLLGVTLSLFFAQRDNYSFWYKRLYYFTGQSNIWIGITCLVLAIMLTVKHATKKDFVKNYMYTLKFVFTISITITGLVFCTLLAPFAAGEINAWSFSSLLTHVFTPILAIIDFFVDDFAYIFSKKHLFFSTLPPLLYMIFSMILSLFNVDFGRGLAYPYFFLNIKSPEGFFGFSGQRPFVMGTFYWLLFMLGLILGIAFLYTKIHPNSVRLRKQKKLENNKN